MVQRKFFIISLITIFVIAILHYLAFKYFWYWNLEWFHILMHILGGFWISITALLISIKFNHIDTIVGHKSRAFKIVVISLIIIGISWELFEILSGFTSIKESGYLDGLMNDLVSNFIGGLVAYFYFIKRKRCEKA